MIKLFYLHVSMVYNIEYIIYFKKNIVKYIFKKILFIDSSNIFHYYM